jgi:hypothetical protein
MSSSKIKVDPRTFKIINQAQSPDKSKSQTTTETFTSDQESSTSVNSDTESVKVIKLDNPQQSGGLGKQNGPLEIVAPQVKVQQTQDRVIKQDTSTSTTSNLKQAPITKLPSSNQIQPQEKNGYSKENLFNYLSINSNLEKNTDSKLEESEPENTDTASNPTTILSDNEEDEKTLEEKTKSEPQAEDTTQDVFDLTQNKLYQVLSKLFESTKGDGIGENLDKISKLFEAHNQIMEKLLNQLIIMNTNYKQVKVPDAFQSSTKQAGNITEFRKKIDQLDQRSQKKD